MKTAVQRGLAALAYKITTQPNLLQSYLDETATARYHLKESYG